MDAKFEFKMFWYTSDYEPEFINLYIYRNVMQLYIW